MISQLKRSSTSELYKSTNYLCKSVPFLISNYIREYDISKANINVLYKYGMISEEQYNYFLQCPRMERQRSIGIMELQNPKITEVKKQGIMEAKRMFFEANDIQDEDILSIKNDAIFLVNKSANITKFDNIEFVNKNIYTSYYLLGNIEIYYYYDQILNIEKTDVKGIGKEKLRLHDGYFLEFLEVCFQSAQVESIKDTISIIVSFYNKYLRLELDKGYYRNFDNRSLYSLKPISNMYSYDVEFISDKNIKDIDISCNLNRIRDLWGYYSSVYLKR